MGRPLSEVEQATEDLKTILERFRAGSSCSHYDPAPAYCSDCALERDTKAYDESLARGERTLIPIGHEMLPLLLVMARKHGLKA